MHLNFNHNCTNSIDLIDEDTDEVVGCIHGPNEGDEDVTQDELDLAEDICNAYNNL